MKNEYLNWFFMIRVFLLVLKKIFLKIFFIIGYLDLILKLYFLWMLFKIINNYVCFIYMNVCIIKKKKFSLLIEKFWNI